MARLKQLVEGGFYREISVRSDAICGRTHPIVIDYDGYEFAVDTFLGGLTPISLEEVGSEYGLGTSLGNGEEASACAPRPYVEYFEEDWFAW